MDLNTAHKALIGSAVAFFTLIAVQMWMKVANTSPDFVPMAAFNTVAALGLAVYLVHFVRKTRQRPA